MTKYLHRLDASRRGIHCGRLCLPIFKGGQRSATSNYRPVSLTSQICKLFEAVVRDEVVEFLDNLIRDSQHGFRKGRSCLTNLLLFLDQVLRSVDEGLCVDIVFLDLAI